MAKNTNTKAPNGAKVAHVGATNHAEKMFQYVDGLNRTKAEMLERKPGESQNDSAIREFFQRGFDDLAKLAKNKHAKFITLSCEPFKVEKTLNRCVVIGYNADGKFFVGTSRQVHIFGDDSYAKPKRVFDNQSDFKKFLKELSLEKSTSSEEHNAANQELVKKAQNAASPIAAAAENLYGIVSQNPEAFFSKHLGNGNTENKKETAAVEAINA